MPSVLGAIATPFLQTFSGFFRSFVLGFLKNLALSRLFFHLLILLLTTEERLNPIRDAIILPFLIIDDYPGMDVYDSEHEYEVYNTYQCSREIKSHICMNIMVNQWDHCDSNHKTEKAGDEDHTIIKIHTLQNSGV